MTCYHQSSLMQQISSGYIRQDQLASPSNSEQVGCETLLSFYISKHNLTIDKKQVLEFGEATFDSGWQVLLGQRQVVNYMRSSKEKLVPMRYPGEFTFPGGAVDAGESPEQTARREFAEELLFNLPADANLRLLSVRQTLPVKNKSNIIFHYVAHEDENPWLRIFDVDHCNAKLKQRYEACQEDVQTGAFWDRPKKERESLSPEVHKVAWLDIADAVEMSYLPYANEYQATGLAALGITKRDPIFLTLVSMREIEAIPSLQLLARLTDGIDEVEAREKAIWLQDGLSPAQTKASVDEALKADSPLTAERFATLKRERSVLDLSGKQNLQTVKWLWIRGCPGHLLAGAGIMIFLALLSRRLTAH